MWLWKTFLNVMGRLIGLAELLGFRFPVRKYKESVSSSLWRGSRVGAAEIRDLSENGFRLIINLCAENNTDAEIISKLGLHIAHVRIPVVDNTAPTVEQMFCFLKYITNNSFVPAYIHCEAGKGRTSVFVAVYCMAILGRSCLQSIAEAKAHGMIIPDQEDFLKRFYLDYVAQGNWQEAINASPVD